MTDWAAVFAEAEVALTKAPVYHGKPLTSGGPCLWIATADAYYDVTGESLTDSEPDDFSQAVRILHEATGVPGDGVAVLYRWNDSHSDEAVRAAIARSVELVS
jgi:hypothetical protein